MDRLPAPDDPITLGISSCLLGEEVRFDGNHKRDAYIVGTLARVFRFIPVCPETAIGLGIPREPIRLEGDPGHPRAAGVRNRELEVTEPLRRFGERTAGELEGISGYILKSKSPSCGMERVKVYRGDAPAAKGVGVYARALMDALPELPVEEEGRLGDAALRENFIERVFAYRRWQDMEREGITAAGLVDFHTRHKLVLMSHGREQYTQLGRLVAEAGKHPIAELSCDYIAGFMAALRRMATRRRHADVLQHLAGYLKKALDRGDKAELAETIDAYRRGLVPLVVPLTLLRHHFRRHPHPYVVHQVYLEPHPPELMLRNSI